MDSTVSYIGDLNYLYVEWTAGRMLPNEAREFAENILTACDNAESSHMAAIYKEGV